MKDSNQMRSHTIGHANGLAKRSAGVAWALMVLGSLLVTASARGQWTIHTLNGDATADQLGQSVSGAGDVNGDGVPDFIAGAYRNDGNGSDAGLARVYSGADGSILYTFSGDAAGDWFGWSVSGAGDVNGDNFADVVVGAPGIRFSAFVGYVRVFSGVDGSILYTFNADSPGDWFGGSVSGAGDVDADGFADLIVGAMFDDNNGNDSGSARVFSGFDGTALYTFNGDSNADRFGNAVSGAGDVNADGFADLIVGAASDDNFGVRSGSVRIFSGINGSVLYRFLGDTHNDNFGHSVSGAGDVNGDGFDDVIVGIPSDDNNGTDSGSVRVFSGKHGSRLYTLNGDAEQDLFGLSVSGAGDINGDGFADLIVGAPLSDNNGPSSGSVRVFSGVDRAILFDMDGEVTADFFGTSVSGVGDINGDGLGDFIVGVIGDDNNGSASGSVRLVLSIPDPSPPDADSDGVPDAQDLCPGTLSGEPVDLNGCSDSQVDSDGDGFCNPDALSSGPSGCTGSDNCPDSDPSPTIVIDGIDTGVENEQLGDGCTLADLIDAIVTDDPTSVDVVEFLVDLKAEGFITGQDLGAILKELNSP